MAYEEFSGELDKPTKFEEFNGELDKPSSPTKFDAKVAPEVKGPGLIDQVIDFFKPAPASVMEGYVPTEQDQAADVKKRLSYGAGPILPSVVEEASAVKEGRAKSNKPVVNRVANEMRRRGEETLNEKAARFIAQDQDRINEEVVRDNRRKFAEDNPILGSLAAGGASQTAGLINAPSVVADFFNQSVVNPVLEVVGLPKVERTPTMFGTEYLTKGAADFMPKVGRKDMGKAYDDGEFGLWLMSKVAANSPQMAMSLAAAFVPPLRAALLPTMGATSAGSSFVEGDDSRVAAAKGLIEVGTEMLPLGVFDKVGDVLKGMSVQKQNAILAIAGQRMLQAGTAITANGLTNAIEEAAAQFGGNVLDKYFQGKDISLMDKVDEAAVVGAVAGNVMSLPQVGGVLAGKGEPRNIAAQEFSRILNNSNFNPSAVNAAVGNSLRLDGVSEAINPAATKLPPASPDPIEQIILERTGGRREPSIPGGIISDTMAGSDGRVEPTLTSFTPADSPSAQAGLAPIVVPTAAIAGTAEVPQVNPDTERAFGLDQLRMGGANVSTGSDVGTTAGVGGIAGSDQSGRSLGVSGPDVSGAAGVESRNAGAPAVNAGSDLAARGDAGKQFAGVTPQQNNNAVVEPAKQWFGRKGDGYVTEGDAKQAVPGRQRMFPELSWSVERMPDGKYRLAGYSQETNNGTQAAQAKQAETQRQEAPVASTRQPDSAIDLALEQAPLPDTVLAELSSNPGAANTRAAVQTHLDNLAARGLIPAAPQLGAPDTDSTATINVLGNLIGDATGLGQRVVPYKEVGGSNGFAVQGTAFVNTWFDRASVSADRTTFHEIRHVAEQIAAADTAAGRTNTPAQVFTAELDSIFDDIKDEGKRAYVENFLHKDELDAISDPAERQAKLQEFLASPLLKSEMVADFLGNRATDREFLVDLARQDPKGFEGFVKRWLAVIDNMIAKLRGGKSQDQKESAKVDQYIRDLNVAKMIARDALIQFRKGNLGEVQVDAQIQADAVPAMSKREKVGEFDVRTMKDGTTLVYGDPEAIRAQIPDDVKGRVTKDGIMFTTSAAPRVKAALGGRTTAYSREGAVLDKLPMKDGKYVGAPEKFNTPGKIPTLRKLLRQLADEGAPGRYWYENSGKEVLKMVGGDMQEARKFVALLAIYSPQTKVDANSTFALRAWAQYKNGQPISVKTSSQDRKATEAMQDVDAFWKGEKTGNFFFNLLREIDPSTAGKQGATIDMWMMRAGQYENDAPTATQYAFMENETNRLAAELGWEPQQVQAAIWVAMKARMENAGVKKMTEASSEKKGWIKFVPGKDGKGKVRVIINDQKHRDNWLKYSFEHDVTKSDTQQAKFDFGDGLKRHIGQVSFEARPGRTTGVLPGIHSAPYAQQVEFQQAVQKAFLDDQGNDRLAMYLGLLVDNDILVPGVWQSEVSPSTQLGVAMAPAAGGKVIYDKQDKKIITAKEAEAIDPNWKDGDRIVEMLIDPSQAEALNVYTAIAGLVARQEGVGWHRPFYSSTKRDANGLDINIGRTINPAEAKDIETAVDKWMADNGHTGWQDRFAFISSPTGIRIVNFGIITNEKLQSDILRVAESVLPDGDVRVFASSGDMPTNNWKENPNGETYVQRVSAAGRSDVLDWARANLAPRVQRVFTEFSDKYGWGDAGEIRFSKRERDGAGRDQGRSIAPLAGAPVIQGATGPDSRLVQVAEQYARDNGIDLRRQAEYVQVDPVRARRIANAYEVMRHAPQDPKVKEAFQNLIDQTIAQYRALESAGYKFYLFDETNDPYQGNPWNAMRELRNDQVMGVFATEAGFGSTNEFNAEDNPLLADTGIKWPYGSVDGKPKRVLANDLFRAVHDAFGHGLEGAGFRAQGEENAWQAHVRLFTGSAVGAITSETRGQNSWLNYGPNAERNQSARVEDTVFADQKTGLMPEWTWTEGRADDMPAFSKKQQDTSPFYSQLARAIEGVPERLATQPAAQWKAWLASNAAKLQIKKEEIEWTGINDYLDLRGKDKVTKADIAEYLNANGVQVEEVMKSSAQDTPTFNMSGYGSMEMVGGTKYTDYQLPGGENYRELLLTLPEANLNAEAELKQQQNKAVTLRELQAEFEAEGNTQRASEFAKKAEFTEARVAELEKLPKEKLSANYRSSHWDEKNILAHVRFNDRTDADGKKVLFIEELQSDWAQDGRKRGFKGKTQEDAKQFFGISDADWTKASEEDREAYRLEMIEYKGRDGGIPLAPFVTDTKSWLSLGIKRMIAYAADNSYDKVAFVNGQQSADRYDLSKSVDSITYEPTEKGFYINVMAEGKNIKDGDFTTDELEDIVGKEIVEKMEARKGERPFDPAIEPDLAETRTLSGIDLKVGGEGMKTFYDEIVPQTVGDVLKKLKVDGKVETVNIGTGAASRLAVVPRNGRFAIMDLDAGIGSAGEYQGLYQTRKEAEAELKTIGRSNQTGFSITDSMREKVAEGLPMFSKRQAEAEVKTDDEVVKLFTDLQNARGLKGVRAKEAASAHPMGEQIVKINNDFYDILEKLDDAGLIEINC